MGQFLFKNEACFAGTGFCGSGNPTTKQFEEIRMKKIIAASAMAVCAAIPAQGELVYAYTSLDQLISFDSLSPGNLISARTITGLQTSESLLGIDYRPANGLLYALGDSSRLYTINPATGAATQVGTASSRLSSTELLLVLTSILRRTSFALLAI